MIKVGVIGLGMMGNTHLDVYAQRDDVEIVAVADIDPKRLAGKEKAGGNIKGQAQGGFDLSKVARYDEGKKLIADKNVDLVDVCLPTPLHLEFGKAVLAAGKHLLTEKPLARTAAQAKELAAAAARASTLAMPAMCMRFWPAWVWLKEAVADGRYGPVHAATFRRVAQHPGGPFYEDGDACGGALLDLHIHDTDFIQFCFGKPKAVTSVGYSSITNQIDHVLTHYAYDDIPLVAAEGGWAMAKGFGFQMQYCVNFANATATFDIGRGPAPIVQEPGKEAQTVPVSPAMGYTHEIDYFVRCIAQGHKPTTVTMSDGAQAVRIIEAEAQSIREGRSVAIV
ncbi:MAG: Gfo/Idh/MocA family oxidoreductase [Phycisphaeraceae bacterium]